MKIDRLRIPDSGETYDAASLEAFERTFDQVPASILKVIEPVDIEGENFLTAWAAGDETVYDSSKAYYLLEKGTEDDLGGQEAWIFKNEKDGIFAYSSTRLREKHRFDDFMGELLEAMDWTLDEAKQHIFFRSQVEGVTLPGRVEGTRSQTQPAFSPNAVGLRTANLNINTLDLPLVETVKALVDGKIEVTQFETERAKRVLDVIQNLQTEMSQLEAAKRQHSKDLRKTLGVVTEAFATTSVESLKTFCVLTVLDESGAEVGTIAAFKGQSGALSYKGDLIRSQVGVNLLLGGELINLCTDHEWQLVLPEKFKPAETPKVDTGVEKKHGTLYGAQLKELLVQVHPTLKGQTVLTGDFEDKHLILFTGSNGHFLAQIYRDTTLLSNVDPTTLDWEVSAEKLELLNAALTSASVAAEPDKSAKEFLTETKETVETVEVPGVQLLEKANNLKSTKGGIRFEAVSGDLVLTVSKKTRQSVYMLLKDAAGQASDIDPSTLNWEVPKMDWESLKSAQAGRQKRSTPKAKRGPRRAPKTLKKTAPAGPFIPQGNIPGAVAPTQTPAQAEIRAAQQTQETKRKLTNQKRQESIRQTAIEKFLAECRKIKGRPKRLNELKKQLIEEAHNALKGEASVLGVPLITFKQSNNLSAYAPTPLPIESCGDYLKPCLTIVIEVPLATNEDLDDKTYKALVSWVQSEPAELLALAPMLEVVVRFKPAKKGARPIEDTILKYEENSATDLAAG